MYKSFIYFTCIYKDRGECNHARVQRGHCQLPAHTHQIALRVQLTRFLARHPRYLACSEHPFERHRQADTPLGARGVPRLLRSAGGRSRSPILLRANQERVQEAIQQRYEWPYATLVSVGWKTFRRRYPVVVFRRLHDARLAGEDLRRSAGCRLVNKANGKVTVIVFVYFHFEVSQNHFISIFSKFMMD